MCSSDLEKLKTTKLINEKEIRKEIRGINLTYEEFEEKVGKSISYICFENNAKFMKENCKERDLEKLKEEISSLNETLSENYISNIAKKIIIEDEIQLRLGKTFKQESIEENKEEKKEEIREIYEESEKEKFEKIEINEVIKANENTSGFLKMERDWITKFLNHGYIDTFRLINGDLKDKYSWWSYRAKLS